MPREAKTVLGWTPVAQAPPPRRMGAPSPQAPPQPMPPPRKIYPRRTRTSSQQPPLRRPPTQREAALEPRPRRVTRTRTSPPADTKPTLKMPPAYADPYFDAETMAMVDRERRALLVRRVIGVLLAVASLAYIIAAI